MYITALGALLIFRQQYYHYCRYSRNKRRLLCLSNRSSDCDEIWYRDRSDLGKEDRLEILSRKNVNKRCNPGKFSNIIVITVYYKMVAIGFNNIINIIIINCDKPVYFRTKYIEFKPQWTNFFCCIF